MAILLLGLGLRADYAWQGRAPVFDAVAYARIAQNLDEDRGFTLGREATQPAEQLLARPAAAQRRASTRSAAASTNAWRGWSWR